MPATLTTGSTGPDVMLVQSLLSKIGYNPGPIDGDYGPLTASAVEAYQADNGLDPDGIVGPLTWASFQRILRGYDNYTIRPGDTLFRIARRYYTTVNAILTANPGINPLTLAIGQTIKVPYGIDVVFTDIDYPYDIMEMNIQALKARYPFLEVGIAGNSVMGRRLYYLRLGRGPNQVFYNASHHALEWINTPVLMKFAENFLKAYSVGGNIRGYNIPDIWNFSSIYIIPMVNPDGVDIVIRGISPDNPYYNSVISQNTSGLPLSQAWTANIRGTDLNLNYPAGWEEEKAFEEALGITGPREEGYGGPSPLSEPETQAVANFTTQHNFRLVIAYHTQGRVIYWQYKNYAPPEALSIAQTFANISGYSIELNPIVSAGAGYKDWFLQQYRRPGYTIETGIGKNPLPITQFNTIYSENEGILLQAAVT